MGRKNIRKKVIAANASSNPFDIKINRKKHNIIGQKVKGTQGLPGVSRALGHAKRKEFLNKKKIKAQKANCFRDKRLMKDSMPLEEQMTSRLVLERQNKLKKVSFNLNDEENLTHKGIPLHEFPNYEDKVNDSDDEEQLSENFVKQAHFGGFSNSNDETPKSHKEIINELIVESKKRKYEKKIENEENAELTEKLDHDWKDILSLMGGIKSNKQPERTEKKDSYDIALQELKYEMKAPATSRLKTAEEIAIEEENRFKKLEMERIKRMNDSESNINNDKYLSADSIDDGFNIEPIPVEDTYGDNDDKLENSEEEDDSSSFESDNDEIETEDFNAKDKYVESKNPRDKNSSMIPETKAELEIIAKDSTSVELSNEIAKILKSCLPCKSEKRLVKLEKFFSLLIEFMNDICENSVEKCTILFPYLYDLAQSSPLKTGEFILSCLDQEHLFFQESLSMKTKTCTPRIQCLLLLKLCSSLYSVSDFRHPVMTPAFILMCDIISHENYLNLSSVVRRLFICNIFMNCLSDSKRFAPEVLVFLNKILLLGKENKKNKCARYNLSFCPIDFTENTINELNLLDNDLKCDDLTKVSVIYKVINQLQNLAHLYSYLPAYEEIFEKSINICNRLPLNKYPDTLKEAIKTFQCTVSNNVKPLRPLTFINMKPKPLKMFEPEFDSKFSLRKNDISKKRKLVKSVEQKIKKEEKCVLREIRREAQVLATEKLSEKLEADEERKRKVKQLYHELAMQEGEYKKFAKKN